MQQTVSNERLTEIIQTYGDMVYRLALSYTTNNADAEDIYQTVFLKLVENVWKLKSEEHVKYWLIRVTINCCKKSFRHKNKTVEYNDSLEKEDEEHTELVSENLVEDFILTKEVREMVRDCLGELRPEEYRVILYLMYYEQLSVNEIANIMSLTPGATRTK